MLLFEMMLNVRQEVCMESLTRHLKRVYMINACKYRIQSLLHPFMFWICHKFGQRNISG